MSLLIICAENQVIKEITILNPYPQKLLTIFCFVSTKRKTDGCPPVKIFITSCEFKITVNAFLKSLEYMSLTESNSNNFLQIPNMFLNTEQEEPTSVSLEWSFDVMPGPDLYANAIVKFLAYFGWNKIATMGSVAGIENSGIINNKWFATY